MDTIAEQVRALFQPMLAEGEKDLPGRLTSLVRFLGQCQWIAMDTQMDTVRFTAADGSTAEIHDARAFTKVRLPLSALAVGFIRRTGKDAGEYIYSQHQPAHFTFDDGLDLCVHLDLTNSPSEQSFRLQRLEEMPSETVHGPSVQA